MTRDANLVRAVAVAIGRHFRDPKAKPNDDALASLFEGAAQAALAAAREYDASLLEGADCARTQE